MYSNAAPRSSFLSTLWRRLTGKRSSKRMEGSQRSAVISSQRSPHYDQEIPEYPIRDHSRAMELIKAIHGEKLFIDVLSYLERDCFSSGDGDDRGFTISKTLDDGKTPISPDVYAIGTELIRRKNGGHYVIGGNRLQPAVKECAGYGDSFWQLGIERDGLGSYAITDTLKMPCWEMFRKESDIGELIQFEQRRRLMETAPEFTFSPVKMLHLRYRRRGLYGQSLFAGAMGYRTDYSRARQNAARVTNDTGVTPFKFKFPEGTIPEQKKAYQTAMDNGLKDGAITAIYLDHGVDVERLGSDIPNFDPLTKYVKQLEYGLIPAGFPVWLIPGLESTGARDISGGPERAYSRFINDFRATLTEGVRHAIDIELYLKLGPDRYQSEVVETGYTLVWPKIATLTNPGNAEDTTKTDADGMQDVDSESRVSGQHATDLKWLYNAMEGVRTNGSVG